MSFSKVAIGIVFFAGCAFSFAQEGSVDINNWIRKSEQIINGAQSMPDWLRSEPPKDAMIAAEKLKKRAEIVREKISAGQSPADIAGSWVGKPVIKSAEKANQSPVETEPYNPGKTESFIFISQSMTTSEVKAAIEVSTETGATLVFRGIKQGQAIDHVGRFVGEIIKGNKDLRPTVIINPVLFTEYAVESVPTSVVIMDGVMIRATGTISIDYLLSELEDEKSGDLGLIGSVKPVAEPDMIEEMKRRAALIDWEKAKEGAADRYWTESWFHVNLPASEIDDIYFVDPTFVLKNDIVARGKVLAAKGSRYNAQKIMPMTQYLIFFNGFDDKQVKRVKKFIEESSEPIEKFVFILTDIDRKNGFKALEALNAYFGRELKVMEKGMKERFALRAVPSVVSGSGENYKVQQIAVVGVE